MVGFAALNRAFLNPNEILEPSPTFTCGAKGYDVFIALGLVDFTTGEALVCQALNETRKSEPSGGALDGVDVLLRNLVDRGIDRADHEAIRSERAHIVERGVDVEPGLDVGQHDGHAIVIGRHQLVRLVGEDRERRDHLALDVRVIPDGREHHGLAVAARKEIRLLPAVLLAPFIEAFRRNHAAAVGEHGLERAAPQRVGARIEQRRPFLAAVARQIDSEPRHARGERLAALGEEGRHLLGRRDVRVVLEIDQGARQRARDLAPLLQATDAVAHGRRSRCSRSAAKGPGTRPEPGVYFCWRSPRSSFGCMNRNATRAMMESVATIRKATAQVACDMPPPRSSVQPMTSGPIKPPMYPSIEWTARVAPRFAGSAVPAVPAVNDDESSHTIGP